MTQIEEGLALRPTTTKKQSKKQKLLTNRDVERWYDNLARASKVTADVRLRRLGHFCETVKRPAKITPMEFADFAMKDLRAATDLIQDHITWMQMEDPAREKHPKPYAGGYIESTLTAVKSWLAHWDIAIKRRIRITDADSTPTTEDEKVPDGAELDVVYKQAASKAAACIVLIAKSGVRPQVLGNYDASDGLMLQDLPYLKIGIDTVICTHYPCKVIVRKTINKVRHKYFTYIGRKGTRIVLAYLNTRLADGEKLSPTSPLIAPDKDYDQRRLGNNEKKFLATTQIRRIIKEAFTNAGFDWRPYLMRSLFDTQMLLAENDGQIAHAFSVFFMGHKGDIEATYTTKKGRLPDKLIEAMEAAYLRCEKYLDLEDANEDPLSKQKQEIREKMLVALETSGIDVLGKMQEMLDQLASARSMPSNQAEGNNV